MYNEGLILEKVSYSVQKKEIIKKFNLKLLPGEIVAIMGPNGSGKTTLLKLISGLIPLSSGSITVQGNELHALSRLQKSRLISLVPQSPQISFEFTAKDIILMGAYASENISNKENLDEVLERLSIKHLQDSPFPCLSAGERQRCYLARALVSNTPFMLLDEPNSNQDVKGKEILTQELASLKALRKGVLFATHDLDAAKKSADRIISIEGI